MNRIKKLLIAPLNNAHTRKCRAFQLRIFDAPDMYMVYLFLRWFKNVTDF